jgi:hypothetical protein
MKSGHAPIPSCFRLVSFHFVSCRFVSCRVPPSPNAAVPCRVVSFCRGCLVLGLLRVVCVCGVYVRVVSFLGVPVLLISHLQPYLLPIP